ncbi:telomerase reverse transcriptase [Lasallia pustulata]|uniref:Telomerase reverse transcriptase n=1 Tax=Lasallia pustulata TaxID=136370 RepID=A0A1W5CTH2_9LECA|nr:telomerase reverse transcriptase [Lasallia pustulata]
MARKRKRSHKQAETSEGPRKRGRLDAGLQSSVVLPKDDAFIKHPLLSLYYPRVLTLRDYLLSQLPPSARSRRRRLSSAGTHHETFDAVGASDDQRNTPRVEDDGALAKLLDSTLIGQFQAQWLNRDDSRIRELATFSQKVTSTIINFAIWHLFYKTYRNVHKPSHLLCYGYQRANAPRTANEDHGAGAGIPGITSHYPNNQVSTFRSALWADILNLLGKEGERTMLNLALDCGVFIAVESGRGNFYQLSGIPLSELHVYEKPATPLSSHVEKAALAEPRILAVGKPSTDLHTPGAITLVRNRMFYARAALNAKGEVRFGLRHIHALNRYGNHESQVQTVHLMKYVFPRQFGLHNVFTSTVDTRETVQPFKDYTLREQEITLMARQKGVKRGIAAVSGGQSKEQLPKRLRGLPAELIKKLQKLHGRCPYSELLKHYCPVDHPDGSWRRRTQSTVTANGRVDASLGPIIQGSKRRSCTNTAMRRSQPSVTPQSKSVMDYATPPANVSAFCRATLSKLIPIELWGIGQVGQENRDAIMCQVERFVRARRFESLSLHALFEGLKITGVPWLASPNTKSTIKISQSDFRKRKEIFLEFIYYVFDSLLIPLVRSNFHVTESNVHRNRLFFFRHDVWRALTEPAMSNLKLTMFEEIRTDKARRLLDARPLGFSQIRLLPKQTGFRPIMNLRRRSTKLQNGKVLLGRSINSVMAPVFNMLSYEKTKQPDKLGSALFSVGDIYPKLKSFRARLQGLGKEGKPLFFAKVDVQSCFDTIPQRRVVRLMEQLATEDGYRIARHAEIKPSENHNQDAFVGYASKPARKFVANARAATDFTNFDQVLKTGLAVGKKNVVFVDGVVQTFQDKEKLLDLLEEHVEGSVVKIGKKFFRQKQGIPQGSVLSSLLCNFFYAELERECLGFLEDHTSVLLRLIDDFLLITADKEHAERFLGIMHDGSEKYGTRVNPGKSLVNFKTSVGGVHIPRFTGGKGFPYCGNLIDTKTLEITKDRDRRKITVMADSLTVELSRAPGRTFHRKALNAFKIQTHAMFFDTTFNSLSTVLSTIYQNFVEAAMKFYRYAKCLCKHRRPQQSLMIKTIHDLVNLAFVLIKSKHKNPRVQGYQCAINRLQIQWLASTAFRTVLGRKQSNYDEVITWLDSLIASCRPRVAKDQLMMQRVVDEGKRVFSGFKY